VGGGRGGGGAGYARGVNDAAAGAGYVRSGSRLPRWHWMAHGVPVPSRALVAIGRQRMYILHTRTIRQHRSTDYVPMQR